MDIYVRGKIDIVDAKAAIGSEKTSFNDKPTRTEKIPLRVT